MRLVVQPWGKFNARLLASQNCCIIPCASELTSHFPNLTLSTHLSPRHKSHRLPSSEQAAHGPRRLARRLYTPVRFSQWTSR